jgi:DNA-binding Xre family transcriptional regulator
MSTWQSAKRGETKMLTLDEIKRLLADRRLNVVSAATAINRNTLAQIRDGKNENPTLRTMQRLSEYLTGAGVQ